MAKQSKEEYKVARRKSYESNRRALDPKLDRQLKEIADQNKRRIDKWYAEVKQGEKTGVDKSILWKEPVSAQKFRFAKSERKRRTARARDKK
jgi:hypothetical protein